MKIVFSPSKRRPGCVLQAAMGGTVPSDAFYRLFPAETWLVGATDDMAAYLVDEEHSLEWLSQVALDAVRTKRPYEAPKVTPIPPNDPRAVALRESLSTPDPKSATTEG